MKHELEIRPGRYLNITIYEGRADQATIFLFHGLGGRAEHWREQIRFLQNKYRLIVPDLFGQGANQRITPPSNAATANPYRFSEMEKDVQAIFTRFAGKTNYLFGHSYGGALATFLAVKNSSRVEKIVLLAPLACEPVRQGALAKIVPLFLLNVFRKGLDKVFEKRAFDKHAPIELLVEERLARTKNPLDMMKALVAGLEEIPQLDLSSLQIPILIICGVNDGILPTPGIIKAYQNLPKHQVAVIDAASHMVLLEQSTRVNQLITDFLNQDSYSEGGA